MKERQIFYGTPVSSGIAIGKIWVYTPEKVVVLPRKTSDKTYELNQLENAIEKGIRQLDEISKEVQSNIGGNEASIFEAHKLFLQDPEFIKLIKKKIKEDGWTAAWAVKEASDEFASLLEKLDNKYFRERSQDIRDISTRLISLIQENNTKSKKILLDEPAIVVAIDLTPSDTIKFQRDKVLGFAIAKGGPTSHAAILAKSLGIPAITKVNIDVGLLSTGMQAILNGDTGLLVINPNEYEINNAYRQKEKWLQTQKELLVQSDEQAMTNDGHKVKVVANIGGINDAQLAIKNGAEGVGLFRTEFLFLDRETIPSEDEQIKIYNKVFQLIGKEKPIVVRTLDIGGDKAVPYLNMVNEQNPFLGWRAIRMIKEHPELLVVQLRALLQAGFEYDLKIMIPMISQIEEIETVNNIFNKVLRQLEEENIPHNNNAQLGMMIEIPSTAILAHHFAKRVDFFSIGTNDLTQYTLAVDRTNERVAYLASALHPAVLQLINNTIKKGHEASLWVGLCGEMAGDDIATPILLGMGLDEFSVSPSIIPSLKANIRQLNYTNCRTVAEKALTMETAHEVIEYINNIFPH